MLEMINIDKLETQSHEDEFAKSYANTSLGNQNSDSEETRKNQDTQEIPETSSDNTTKEDINVHEKLELGLQVHDESDDTILYDVTENEEDDLNSKTKIDTNKNSSNIAPAHSDHLTDTTVDTTHEVTNPFKQKDTELAEIVTPVTTAKAETRNKKTLWIRIQRLSKHQMDKAVTQIKEKSNQDVTNSKAKKIFKETPLSGSVKKVGSTDKLPKFTFSSHTLPRKIRKKYIFRCPITGCKKVFNTVKN